MPNKCLSLLPVSAAFILLAATLSAYLLGLLHKETLDYLPYPSDIALQQPEDGIFMVGVAFSGSVTFAVILLRFIQVNTFYPMFCSKSNYVSFFSGMLMLVGLYMVPAFPYTTHCYLHYTGAGIFFGFMILFMITQTRITHLHPYNHTKCLARFRILLCALACATPVAFVCGRLLAPEKEEWYMIPQSTQWFQSLLYLIFMCTFAWDFSRIHLRLNSYEVCPRSPDTRKLTRRPADDAQSTM